MRFQILDDDDDGEGWEKKYKAGDSVKAVVLSVQRDEQKVSFSLKPSRLPDLAAADDDESDEEMAVDEDAASDDLQIHLGEDGESEEEEVEDEDAEMEDATVRVFFDF
jgi:rRNA biogenesis protein RRP5